MYTIRFYRPKSTSFLNEKNHCFIKLTTDPYLRCQLSYSRCVSNEVPRTVIPGFGGCRYRYGSATVNSALSLYWNLAMIQMLEKLLRPCCSFSNRSPSLHYISIHFLVCLKQDTKRPRYQVPRNRLPQNRHFSSVTSFKL